MKKVEKVKCINCGEMFNADIESMGPLPLNELCEKCSKKISEKIERFCYLKVKVAEFSEELEALQTEILEKAGELNKHSVPPYGALSYQKRENWKVLDVPVLFKKIGKDTFLEICSVAAGKLKKAVGAVGFKKLVSLKIIEQGPDSEFFVLKRNGVFKEK